MNPYIRDYNFYPFTTKYLDSPLEYNKIQNSYNGSCFKVFHQNIRSLAKNVDEFNIRLSQFDKQFECMVLTETWKIYDTSWFNIDGYDLIYNGGDINKNDGTVVYIKNSINYVSNVIKISDCNAIVIKCQIHNVTIKITAIYRPPSTSPINFVQELYSYLHTESQEPCDFHIIVGDTNLNILHDKKITSDYLNVMSEFNFVSTINTYTRIQGIFKSCIDHIFIQSKKQDIENICSSFVLNSNITDHCSIILNLNLEITSYKHFDYYKKLINYKTLKSDLQSHNWETFYNLTCVVQASHYLSTLLSEKINQHTKTIKIRKNQTKRKKWITSGLINSINTRDKLYKIHQKDPNNDKKRQTLSNIETT